jgi:hypothetical protein
MRKNLGAAAMWLMVLATTVGLIAGDTKQEPASESNAVGVVRLFVSAENDYFHAHGRYATAFFLIKFGDLERTATQSPENLPAFRKLNLQSDSEPLPSFVLGSVVSADGSAYKLSLTPKIDKCGLGVFTDERGILYEGKPIECATTETTSSLPQDLAPPDVAQPTPAARTETPCPLPQLLHEASNRVQELGDNLQRFSAKERVEHVEIDKRGKHRNPRTNVFDYVAEIRQDVPGQTYVEEYRSGAIEAPLPLVDTGTAAFALIFHPRHIEQFAMSCEGLTNMGTRAVWQLNFAQRPDRVNDFHGFRVKGNLYHVKLKGRAWIAADNYEVVRLETDLMEPIKEIDLQAEHLAIDYGPVEFPKRKLQLWLPGSASLYVDYHGHRYQRRHDFSDFRLFWVEAEQQVKKTDLPVPVQNY